MGNLTCSQFNNLFFSFLKLALKLFDVATGKNVADKVIEYGHIADDLCGAAQKDISAWYDAQ